MGRRIGLAAIIALLSLPASAGAQEVGEQLGIAPEADIEALLKRPERISYRYERLPKSEGDGVLVACDVQAACLARAETLFGVFADFAQARRMNPSLFEIRHDLSKWPPRFVMDQLVGYSLLGIRVQYRLVVDCFYRQEGQGLYRGDWRLIENPDRTFSSIDGSFVIKELRRDGRTVSYVRWRQAMRIRKTFVGMKPFIDAVAPKEAMDLLARYSREAERKEAVASRAAAPSHP